VGRKQPPGAPPPPAVQKLRLRYTKRGRLRFTSHRDIARVFERALRRAQVPMAYSAGFSPHPKVSWIGAAATGVASEAEYVEISLAERRDPEGLRAALDAALPDGIDLVEAVEAPVGTSLPDRVEASAWSIRLPEVATEDLERAVGQFLSADLVEVERKTKDGVRRFDARAPVLSLLVSSGDAGTADLDPLGRIIRCAILRVVVRHVTPAVRPDDVLSGLRSVSDLVLPVPPAATRLAQGPLTADGEVADPLAPDRVVAGQPGENGNGATRQVDEVVGAQPDLPVG
jgi:radical SAM-linked protein